MSVWAPTSRLIIEKDVNAKNFYKKIFQSPPKLYNNFVALDQQIFAIPKIQQPAMTNFF